MATDERKDEPRDRIIRFRLHTNEFHRAKLAARGETQGNVSEFIRKAVEEKIERALAA